MPMYNAMLASQTLWKRNRHKFEILKYLQFKDQAYFVRCFVGPELGRRPRRRAEVAPGALRTLSKAPAECLAPVRERGAISGVLSCMFFG